MISDDGRDSASSCGMMLRQVTREDAIVLGLLIGIPVWAYIVLPLIYHQL